MRRSILLLVAIAAVSLSSAAEGQLIYVAFKNPKMEKRFKDSITVFKGQNVLIGEASEGITVKGTTINFTSGNEAKNAMYTGDPARPDRVPYEWKKGEKKPSGDGQVARFAGDDVRHFGMVDALLTLDGVAIEYQSRQQDIEDIAAKRDLLKKGEQAWLNYQGLVAAKTDGLVGWLDNMGYGKAADKLGKVLKKERSAVADGVAAREKTALGSLEDLGTPDKLAEVGQTVTGGNYHFKAQQSQHLHIVYMNEIPDSEVSSALELGERIIEGFRKQFVDPYVDEDFRERIPDTRFSHFYFGPKDKAIHERMGTDYFGITWGRDKERDLNSGGNAFNRGMKGYLGLFQVGDPRDIEGTVAHRIGHNLADLHYGGNQPWLEEAVGYYVSFEFLGRNSLTCFAWDQGSYAKPAQQEAEKTVQLGLKGHFNELALASGPTIEALAIKKLFEINDADFAKAWSVFDFVARETDRTGQVWLRETCSAARRGSDFVTRWRAASEPLFEVEPGTDVFAVIEARWKKFAGSRQLQD